MIQSPVLKWPHHSEIAHWYVNSSIFAKSWLAGSFSTAKKYHLKPTGLLGNARNCCWPYRTSCVVLQVLHKPSHRRDINVSLHLIFSGWGCATGTCAGDIAAYHSTYYGPAGSAKGCQFQLTFLWVSKCQKQACGTMIWHPLAASLPANGSWSLILVRVCCSVSDPRLHCLHGPAVRKLFKCIASFHQCCNV